MLLAGGPAPLRLIPAQPTYLLGGGLLVAFYVLSVTWIAPRFGIGNAIFCVLLGQMISATAIDHFGLFGAMVKPLSLARASGIGSWCLACCSSKRPENLSGLRKCDNLKQFCPRLFDALLLFGNLSCAGDFFEEPVTEGLYFGPLGSLRRVRHIVSEIGGQAH
jgi:hypothetical protein